MPDVVLGWQRGFQVALARISFFQPGLIRVPAGSLGLAAAAGSILGVDVVALFLFVVSMTAAVAWICRHRAHGVALHLKRLGQFRAR